MFGLTAEAGERRYAVLLGVNQGDPSEVVLRFAEDDADRVGRVLADVGDFRPEDQVVLRRTDRRRVLEALASLGRHIEADRAADPDASTLLVVYYSGHADSTALHLGGSRLSFAELTEAVEAMPVDVRVLIVDACRSGGLTRVKGATPAEPFAISTEDRLAASGTAIITSSSAGEDAQESDELGGGVFTHHLVAGLLGAADASDDGAVTLTEAYRYAYAQTLRSTSLQPVVQHPTYAFELRGKDDLVLTRPREVAVRGVVGISEAGTYLVFEAERGGRLVAELELGGPGTIALLPGRYLIRRRDADHVREAEIAVDSSAMVPLDAEAMSVMPYGWTARRGQASRRRAAFALLAGGGVSGEALKGLGLAPVGTLGARIDLPAIVLGVRGRYAASSSQNQAVVLRQRELGADLTVLRLFDLGRVAPGLGLRGGLERVSQSFASKGRAPDRVATVGRVGPLLRVELAPAVRLAIALDVGADAVMAPVRGPVSEVVELSTAVVPYAGAELVLYAF